MKPSELITKIENNEFDSELKKLYVSDSAEMCIRDRYIAGLMQHIFPAEMLTEQYIV